MFPTGDFPPKKPIEPVVPSSASSQTSDVPSAGSASSVSIPPLRNVINVDGAGPPSTVDATREVAKAALSSSSPQSHTPLKPDQVSPSGRGVEIVFSEIEAELPLAVAAVRRLDGSSPVGPPSKDNIETKADSSDPVLTHVRSSKRSEAKRNAGAGAAAPPKPAAAPVVAAAGARGSAHTYSATATAGSASTAGPSAGSATALPAGGGAGAAAKPVDTRVAELTQLRSKTQLASGALSQSEESRATLEALQILMDKGGDREEALRAAEKKPISTEAEIAYKKLLIEYIYKHDAHVDAHFILVHNGEKFSDARAHINDVEKRIGVLNAKKSEITPYEKFLLSELVEGLPNLRAAAAGGGAGAGGSTHTSAAATATAASPATLGAGAGSGSSAAGTSDPSRSVLTYNALARQIFDVRKANNGQLKAVKDAIKLLKLKKNKDLVIKDVQAMLGVGEGTNLWKALQKLDYNESTGEVTFNRDPVPSSVSSSAAAAAAGAAPAADADAVAAEAARAAAAAAAAAVAAEAVAAAAAAAAEAAEAAKAAAPAAYIACGTKDNIKSTDPTQRQIYNVTKNIMKVGGGNVDLASIKINTVFDQIHGQYEYDTYGGATGKPRILLNCRYEIEFVDDRFPDVIQKVILEDRKIYTDDTDIKIALPRASEYGTLVCELARVYLLKWNNIDYEGPLKAFYDLPDNERQKIMKEPTAYIDLKKDDQGVITGASIKFSNKVTLAQPYSVNDSNEGYYITNLTGTINHGMITKEEAQKTLRSDILIHKSKYEVLRHAPTRRKQPIKTDLEWLEKRHGIKSGDRVAMIKFIDSESEKLKKNKEKLKELDQVFEKSDHFWQKKKFTAELEDFHKDVYAIRELKLNLADSAKSPLGVAGSVYTRYHQQRTALDTQQKLYKGNKTALQALETISELEDGPRRNELLRAQLTDPNFHNLFNSLDLQNMTKAEMQVLVESAKSNQKLIKEKITQLKNSNINLEQELLIDKPQFYIKKIAEMLKLTNNILRKQAILKQLRDDMLTPPKSKNYQGGTLQTSAIKKLEEHIKEQQKVVDDASGVINKRSAQLLQILGNESVPEGISFEPLSDVRRLADASADAAAAAAADDDAAAAAAADEEDDDGSGVGDTEV
ncbi:MAG: hypothetical protein H0W88_01025 [Parachlamydiaceae bacterium]|nr:hypothetical protein [Parachlamydiaceae bacterium]